MCSSSLSERSEKSALQWDYALHCIMLSDTLKTILSDRLLANGSFYTFISFTLRLPFV
jgi:hypothetical protein